MSFCKKLKYRGFINREKLNEEKGASIIVMIAGAAFFIMLMLIAYIFYLPMVFSTDTRSDMAIRTGLREAVLGLPFYTDATDAAYQGAVNYYDSQTYNVSEQMTGDNDIRIFMPRTGTGLAGVYSYANRPIPPVMQGMITNVFDFNGFNNYRDMIYFSTDQQPWSWLGFIRNYQNSVRNFGVIEIPKTAVGIIVDTTMPLYENQYYRVFGGDPSLPGARGNAARTYQNPGAFCPPNECFMWPTRNVVDQQNVFSNMSVLTAGNWNWSYNGILDDSLPDGTDLTAAMFSDGVTQRMHWFYAPYYNNLVHQLYKDSIVNFLDLIMRSRSYTELAHLWIVGADPNRVDTLNYPAVIPVHPAAPDSALGGAALAPVGSRFLHDKYRSAFSGWVNVANPADTAYSSTVGGAYNLNLMMELSGGRGLYDQADPGPNNYTTTFDFPHRPEEDQAGEAIDFDHLNPARRQRTTPANEYWATDIPPGAAARRSNFSRGTGGVGAGTGDSLRNIVSMLGIGVSNPGAELVGGQWTEPPKPIEIPWAECIDPGTPNSIGCTDRICELLDFNGTGHATDCDRVGFACLGADCDYERLNLWPRPKTIIDALDEAVNHPTEGLDARLTGYGIGPNPEKPFDPADPGLKHMIVYMYGPWTIWNTIPWNNNDPKNDDTMANDFEDVLANVVCDKKINVWFIALPLTPYDRAQTNRVIQKIQHMQDFYDFHIRGNGADPGPPGGVSGPCDTAVAGPNPVLASANFLAYDYSAGGFATTRMNQIQAADFMRGSANQVMDAITEWRFRE